MLIDRHLPRTRGPLVLAALAVALSAAGCEGQATTGERTDTEQAVRLIRVSGCGGCHDIPGVPGATGVVGPSLHGIGRRVFLAGMLRNEPGAMVRWLRDPQGVVPGNAMPNMGIGEEDARIIAAYLATLR